VIYSLEGTAPEFPFPHPALAETDPDGLLAVGGDLSPRRLLNAYRSGIFPWYNPGQPLLWWSPDPRTLLFPERLHCSRSLRKSLRRQAFEATIDREFKTVMRACAETPRPGQEGTWIDEAMLTAYTHLHRIGHAHSIEIRLDGELVGGLYGIALGRVFFGESMFSRHSDASKAALVFLCGRLRHWGYRLIDCQVRTEHLIRMGAEEQPRPRFLSMLRRWLHERPEPEWCPQTPPTRVLPFPT